MQEQNGIKSGTRGLYASHQSVLENLCKNSEGIDILDTPIDKLIQFSGVSRSTLYRRFSCPEELSNFVRSNLFDNYEKLVFEYTLVGTEDDLNISKIEYAVIAMFDMLHKDLYLRGPVSKSIDTALKFLLQSGDNSFIEIAARKILELTENSKSTLAEFNSLKRALRELFFETIQRAFLDLENGISDSASWPWPADIRHLPLFEKTIGQIDEIVSIDFDGPVL